MSNFAFKIFAGFFESVAEWFVGADWRIDVGWCVFVLVIVVVSIWTELMGKLGSWTARLVTFGKVDVDEESWPAIIFGWCVSVLMIGSVSVWRSRV